MDHPRRKPIPSPCRAALLAALALAPLARAAAPDAVPPEVQYRAPIDDAADTARRLRDATGSLEADLARFAPFVRADLATFRDLCEAEAVLHEKVGAAYKVGNLDEVRRLQAQIGRSERGRNLWRYRIAELRVKQGIAAPSESAYVDDTRWPTPGALADLDALVDAKRAASEAWGRAAELTQPGADPAAADAAKEEGYALDAEREIAQWRYEAALQRERTWTERTVNSTEMAKSLERLNAAQARRAQLRRDEVERDRRGREIERELTAAQKSFLEAYQQAVIEKNRAKTPQR